MKKPVMIIIASAAITLFSCGGGEPTANTEHQENQEVKTEETVSEEATEEETSNESSNTITGSYTLTDMIPITGDKELTEQDTEYITQSKERTINNTTLTINEDGSFERIFPHPSGDGSTKSWEGNYVISEDGTTLTFTMELNGKERSMDFTILGQENEQLSLSSPFGQIEMNYIYTK